MSARSTVAPLLGSVLLAISVGKPCRCGPQQHRDLLSDFRQSLLKFADLPPDPCSPPHGNEEHSADAKRLLFQRAAEIVTQELNATSGDSLPPRERASQTLKKLERMSAEINPSWPEENRFHFEILDLAPALVTKMSFRTDARYFVYGIPSEGSEKANQLWRNVGEDDEIFEREVPRSLLDIYPLHRGPSGNARFLAKFTRFGCGGSLGVTYEAREWDPEDNGHLEQIIKQEGALGLDDKVDGFEWIGTLQTKGPLITLPYCWFSAIDTWDNPSLCAVDTYDLLGDDVRFRSRAYNRPDLVPIAKAIEYAQKRDYAAVLGYCTSTEVAHKLVRDIPPFVFAEDVRMKHTGKDKERVEFGLDRTYRFDVEMLAGRWRVVAFSAQ